MASQSVGAAAVRKSAAAEIRVKPINEMVVKFRKIKDVAIEVVA